MNDTEPVSPNPVENMTGRDTDKDPPSPPLDKKQSQGKETIVPQRTNSQELTHSPNMVTGAGSEIMAAAASNDL